MTTYSYRCRTCGHARTSQSRNDPKPCQCGDLSRRDYSFQLGSTGLTPHFNNAVGQYVTNNQEFNDALRRRSDAASERTGITHSYARLDPGDAAVPPGADEAIETRAKHIRDNKINPATLTQ